MRSKAKWILFLSAILLPLQVFAQGISPPGTGLNLFNPPPGDQSLIFLQWIFGVVPGVLNGYGNQLLGLLFSVFNAAGVALLGTLVVISIYHGVVDLAIKGDFMSGERDKKSIYTIIKIVVATVLIVPAQNTGYSLAQSGVMWIMLQGIGLADQINHKLYTYYAAGGSTFSAQVPTFQDLQPLLLPMSQMLASEVCTYELQALQGSEQQQAQQAAGGSSNVLPSANNSLQSVGFTVNSAARTAIFGQSMSSDPNNPQGQCGSVTWNAPPTNVIQQRLAGMVGTPNPYQQTAQGLSALNSAFHSSTTQAQMVAKMGDQYASQSHAFTTNSAGQYFMDGKLIAKNQQDFQSSPYYSTYQYQTATSASNVAMDAQTITAYEEAAITQAASTLLPVARSIVATKGDPEQMRNLSQSIASGLAGAALAYSTLINPVRQSASTSLDTQLQNMLVAFANKGWIYTPLMIYTTAFKGSQTLSLKDFVPKATLPSGLAQGNAGAAFGTLSSSDQTALGSMLQSVLTGGYINLAANYMEAINAGNGGQAIDFSGLLSADNASTGQTDTYTGYIKTAIEGASNTIGTIGNGLANLPTLMGQGAAGALGGINQGYGATSSYFGGAGSPTGTSDIANAQNSAAGFSATIPGLGSATAMITNILNSAIGAINSMVTDAKAGGFNDQLAGMTMNVGPAGPVLALLLTSVIGHNIIILEQYVNAIFSGQGSSIDAMSIAMKIGGGMANSSLNAAFMAGSVGMGLAAVFKMASAAVGGVSSIATSVTSSIPGVGTFIGGVGNMASSGIDKITSILSMSIGMAVSMFLGFVFIFFAGGLMLYYFLPMVPILNFLLVVTSWFAMVVMCMLGAPIFCVTLIRHDPQGSILGKGERYIVDLLRTALVPAIVTIGAVVFIILFNVLFILITSIVSSFVPLVQKAFINAYMISVLLGVTLMAFAMLILWVADALAKACMSTAVNTVGSMMGEALQHIQGEAASREVSEVTKGVGGQMGASFGQQGVIGQGVSALGKMAEGGGGGKEKKKEG